MKKYPVGSAGEAEQKNIRIMLICFAAITVACILLQTGVIYGSFYTPVVNHAGGAWKGFGVFFTLLSFGALYKASISDEGVTGYCIAWAVLLALGFFTAAGFYAGQY
jgi:hypothetical protein